MMALLNEILDYSKIEQGRLELERVPFSLSSIIGSIHSIYHTLCVEKGLTFEVTSTVAENRWYIGDKARLRQVLFNLINNAVKFTGQGSVQVHISECQIEGKNILRMSVSDTGIGISTDAQKRIFQPFEQAESGTTRRYGGTGLGLAIVKQIAKAMNGDIQVHSAPGLGSTFEATVELTQCEPQKTEAAIEREGNYQGLRVLIVEDNKTNTIIINAFMKKKGFATHSVENGELALQALAEQTYDLILMDNHMPVMDGVETITEIRKLANEKQHTLIFGCTADVFKETREKMLGAGADFILAKPIDDRILNDALHQYSEKLFQFSATRVRS
jgi:CheY-like chemotaxis protein